MPAKKPKPVIKPNRDKNVMIVSPGWIAPNGDFYPNEYADHMWAAAVRFGYNYVEKFTREKWIHLGGYGHVLFEKPNTVNFGAKPTKKQLDTLFDISTAKCRSEWKKDFQDKLTREIRKFVEEEESE